MRVIVNLTLLYGLFTLASGIKEHKFSDLCVGLFVLAFGFSLLVDRLEYVQALGDAWNDNSDVRPFRVDGTFYVLFAGVAAARTVFYHLPFTLNLALRLASVAIVGLALIVASPRLVTKQAMLNERSRATRESRPFKLPETGVRLGLFAVCLAIAAVATGLLIKDEKLRLATFLTTMVVGLVVTKVLPVKALKWVLNIVSLHKLKADD